MGTDHFDPAELLCADTEAFLDEENFRDMDLSEGVPDCMRHLNYDQTGIERLCAQYLVALWRRGFMSADVLKVRFYGARQDPHRELDKCMLEMSCWRANRRTALNMRRLDRERAEARGSRDDS